jgi:hypothetical protein
VAALAAALAKAQAELVKPEKSLTATLATSRVGERERSFRYAPLSSGLDIVRKTLGQHEIAIMQTTNLDAAAGMISLTTMLAHASGEWIASDWPVCPVAETAHPQRMGAALTYARRYALFTLVGIAGEDDLDAPDLAAGSAPRSDGTIDILDQSFDTRRAPVRRRNGYGYTAFPVRSALNPLNPEQSRAQRDRLLAEIGALSNSELATAWAQTRMSAKNALAAEDAKCIEDAFQRRLIAVSSGSASDDRDGSLGLGSPPPAAMDSATAAGDESRRAAHSSRTARPIDKAALPIGKPRRYRNKNHLRFVATQACLVCGRKPSDPHHLKFMQARAMGRKVSDEFTVPLCRTHHRAAHRTGNERAWWTAFGIDPTTSARRLWQQSRGTEKHVPAAKPGQSMPSDNAAPPAQTVAPIIDVGAETRSQ